MSNGIKIGDDFGELLQVVYSNGRFSFKPTAELKMKCGVNVEGKYEVKLMRDSNGEGFIADQESITLEV